MATWEDGPEFAPHERPEEFSAPKIAPLSTHQARVNLSAGAPVARPDTFTTTAQQPSLANVSQQQKPTRNPQQSFELAQASLMSDRVWADHKPVDELPSFDPRAPIALADRTGLFATSHPQLPPVQGTMATHNQWGPAPVIAPSGALSGYPAPPGYSPWMPVAPPKPPLTAQSWMQTFTPAVMICLGLTVFTGLAPLLYLLAFGLAQRIRLKRTPITIMFSIGCAALGLAAIIGLVDRPTFEMWWRTITATAHVVALGTFIGIGIYVYRQLNNPT